MEYVNFNANCVNCMKDAADELFIHKFIPSYVDHTIYILIDGVENKIGNCHFCTVRNELIEKLKKV